MGISDSFMKDLPEDSYGIFIKLLFRAENFVENMFERSSTTPQIDYVFSILSEFLTDSFPELYNKNSEHELGSNVGGIKSLISIMLVYKAKKDVKLLKSRSKGINAQGIAELTAEEKKTAHEHLGFIRSIIEKSELDTKKKNALLNTLNKLAKEIDKAGTKTDMFFGFFSELGFYLGEFGKDSKPLWENINETLRILTKSRAKKENLSLPKIEDILQLPKIENDKGEDE